MPTNDDLQKAFRLMTYLQPSREVAECALQDAFGEVIPSLRATKVLRPAGAAKPSKLMLSEQNLLQLGVYLASQEWEVDQESACPTKAPAYRPTADDMVVRYVKTLATLTMDRLSRHAAVAVGCHLYTYQPNDISGLSEELFDGGNIRRNKKRMSAHVMTRFESLLTDADGHVALGAPSDRERALIEEALSALAPWCPCPAATSPAHQPTFLETCFTVGSESSELERIHALFDPACCGLAQLVREYNHCLEGGDKVLDKPEKMLGVPRFDGFQEPEGGGDGGPRSNPPPLTEAEMSSIRHAVEKKVQRRSQHRGGEFRVYVDGVERGVFTRDYLFQSFDVPHTASCIKVFGEDEDEDGVLLAVFPLHFLEPDDEGLGQSLCVTLAGGQTIELSVAPVRGHGGEPSESVVRLKYTKSPEQADGGRAADAPRPEVAEPRRGGDPAGEHGARGPHHDFWVRAFEGLYPRLKSYALAVAQGRVYDAEDLVQETYCRALRYTKDPEEITNPFAYLWRVMRNVWVDKSIRENAAGVESLDEMLDNGRHPVVEPQVLRQLESRELGAGLLARRGPLTTREKLLLLSHLKGYTCKDIADMLNEDVRVTRSNLNAVRAKVRYRLAAAKKK